MRIAALSDIHGNVEALESVWRCLSKRSLIGEDRPTFNAGDTVAYGPDTMRCIDFVRDASRNILSVAGNYDVNVSRFPEKREVYLKKWGKTRPDKYEALRAASGALTGDAREWLADLPREVVTILDGVRISVSHYVPGSDKEGLLSYTPQARLLEIADVVRDRFDIVIVGHTHSPFVRQAGPVLFVNPGSVGRSWGHPTYAEITLTPGEPTSARILKCPDTRL